MKYKREEIFFKILSEDKLPKIKVPKVRKALSIEESVKIYLMLRIFVTNCIQIGICSAL